MKAIITLIILAGLNTIEPVQNNTQTTLPIKESVMLTMERTPCFGRCPSYKLTIFNTGKVLFDGDQNTENIGRHSSSLSKTQIDEIKTQINLIKLFELQDKYDAKITDIPSCLLYVNIDGKKKKIFDRYGAPKELKEFEKLIDSLVLNSKMTKIED